MQLTGPLEQRPALDDAGCGSTRCNESGECKLFRWSNWNCHGFFL